MLTIIGQEISSFELLNKKLRCQVASIRGYRHFRHHEALNGSIRRDSQTETAAVLQRPSGVSSSN